MKRLLLCLPVLLLLAGCSSWSFSLPFLEGGDEPEPAETPPKKTEPAPSYVVSPQAEAYLTEALQYWTDSGECTDPEKAAAPMSAALKIW